MLVLSRKSNESVVIGQDITITVLDVRGSVIRLGIEAPRHINVRREELLELPGAGLTAAAATASSSPVARRAG